MSYTAVSIEKLSKLYRIGKRERYRTLRDTLVDSVASPFRRLRNFSSGNRNSHREIIWALEDVSFKVSSGEVVGLIGRNGAGKSTLLKILSRITEPTAGCVDLHGRVGSLLEVGTGFHPELTGRENVYLNGAILGMRRTEINQRFDEIVAFSEVEKFIDTPVKHYSSGMYLRLAFAVAAHLEPEILLIDEVLAVGDAAFQEKCLGKMSDVAQAGRTVLFVSHNMSAMRSLCERVVWLDEGRVRADGESDQVIQNYLEAVLLNSMPTDGFTALVDRRDRKGDGMICLTHIRLLNSENAQIAFFKSGQHAKIGIGYRTKEGADLRSVTIGFTLLNSRHQFIAYCQSDFVGETFRNLPPEGELTCEFEKLALMPGRYSLNVAGKVGSVVADGVQHAGEFEVVAGEFYPTKLLPPVGFGDALFEYRWSAEESLAYSIEKVARAAETVRG